MTRRSKKGTSEQPGVSLFPFLAVLLCTMGMLVMLLVAIGQGTSSDHADDQTLASLDTVATGEPLPSETGVPPQTAQTERIPEELKQQYEAARKQLHNSTLETVKSEVENSRWFLDELRGIHKRTTEALKTERDRLGSLETAMSTRFRELKQLRESVKLLQGGDSTVVPGEQEIAKSIAETTQKIEAIKKEIESIKQRLADSKNSYAVVPHRGSSGTQRRPVYIECTKDAIRLMPEGIEFSVEDFLLAKSPANPFDTAIRTARTCYMNKYGDAVGEPYPLLIVRPGGADKYYAALSALSSWGGDYGYEFVDEDWKLEYPPADEEIASRVREQVAYARYKLSVPLAAMIAQSPGLAENGFSGEKVGTGFKTGVSVTQESGGSLFGENVRLSTNAGNTSGTGYRGSRLQGTGYRGTSVNPGGLYANGERSGLPLTGNGSTLATGTANGINRSNSLAHGGSGMNAMRGISSPGNYNEAAQLPGYAGNLVTGDLQSGMAVPYPSSGLGQPLPAYEGQFKSAASGQPQNATGAQASTVGQPQNVTGAQASAAGQPQNATGAQASVAGDQTTGRPATDPSAAIVSQIEGQGETSAAAETASLESGWVTVGNTAMQRQNGSTVNESGSTCPAGSNCSGTPSVLSGTTGDSPEGNSMPQMVAERRKDISDKQKKEKQDPHKLAPYDPYKNQGFNLTQQNRQPVNSVVERPIRVECYPDRIVFPKQPGIRTTQTVMLNQERDQVNEELLRQVASCVKVWGVAGRNMYWTPWIRVQSAANAGQSTTLLQEFFTPQGIAVRPDTTGELR